MRRSYYEVYLHFVWRTKNSEPYLSFEVEREVCSILHIQTDLEIIDPSAPL